MYLGRIITTSKAVKTYDFIERTEDISKVDNVLPTLIVGKQKAIDKYGKENVHIIDRKILPNVYWTYSKMEKRTAFEDDITKFNNDIVKCLEKSVKYYYFNIFTEPFDKIKKFIKFMYGPIKKYVYIKDDHVYIYSTKTVIGFSLRDTKYIGIDSKKVLSRIKSNSNNIIITDNFLSDETKRSIRNINILVPYLYFLKEQ